MRKLTVSGTYSHKHSLLSEAISLDQEAFEVRVKLNCLVASQMASLFRNQQRWGFADKYNTYPNAPSHLTAKIIKIARTYGIVRVSAMNIAAYYRSPRITGFFAFF